MHMQMNHKGDIFTPPYDSAFGFESVDLLAIVSFYRRMSKSASVYSSFLFLPYL